MLVVVEKQVREQMRSLLGPRWTIFGFEAFTVDGSRVQAPRTTANEAAFGTGGRANGMPQATLTTLLHMGSGVPYAYRVGPADGSERHHQRTMMHRLAPGTLLVADAGITGYDLLRDLIAESDSAAGAGGEGRHILIRAGANVRLLQKLSYAVEEENHTVYLWPGDVQRRGERPLTLRLIRVRIDHRRSKRADGKKGKHKPSHVCLLTDLPASMLSDAQARLIYRQRWDIEAFFRGLKQTTNQPR